MSKYRIIYEKTYGPIPKDNNGRTYDIHHKDGNRKNNNPSNLIALTLKEHYDVHFQQGDWASCIRIAKRMEKDAKIISELATQANNKRIKEGTHNFLDGDYQRQINQKRLRDGTHPFLHPKEVICPHCGKVGRGGGMYSNHFKNCKENLNA